ncbi:FtsB family cell division protein [Glutamicibacter bergerei]|uniref:Septum formation initiator family protein n=2 Tax=Glutamicibacter TaxID=1742989 RepID=A0ABV9MH96_9MICC|nr:septum formation initiator family protein [Glutamicibacter ardleyensis]HBV11145.1 hypothetical protein [Micrococcaceae bacterium]
MAQRPPRMPRRNTPTGDQPPEVAATHTDPQGHTSAEHTPHAPRGAHEADPSTDALHIVPTASPSTPSARRVRQLPSEERKTPRTSSFGAPKANSRSTTAKSQGAQENKSKTPLRERAKKKQNERRRDDRMKFSAAVRRKPGEKAQTPHETPAGAPVAAHRFSGRVAALLVVLAFFAVMLVPTVNFYRTQMTEISELRASISEKEAQRDELNAEIARWDDPLYIKQQARERINLVMPGEKLYKVVGELPTEEATATPNGSTYEVRADLPWVDALLDSVHRSATD